MVHKNAKKSFDFINEQVNKKSINKLLAQVYLEFGGAKTETLANTLKNLGYHYATKSGVTILNELYDTTVEGRKINYRYYISEAKKIVADFTEQQLSLFNDQQV